ncbi:hypothetical protein AAG747_16020 [Rapidithrix thailandica]|uniref:Uncharacterized protein n=1 Tax=Rapidithrix thailandica TaxID=413964 RepID=A0AAW9S2J8_9BACT
MKYRVKQEHYPVLKVDLSDAIQKGMGEAYTPNVHKAWDNAIDLITGIMQESYIHKSVANNES